jgi:hypothetical protein
MGRNERYSVNITVAVLLLFSVKLDIVKIIPVEAGELEGSMYINRTVRSMF